MQVPEKSLQNAALAMRVVGWLCIAGLPALVLLYAPGMLWGSVPLDYCLPTIGPAHPPSPYNGLHPYFFMVYAMYLAYGLLMVRGARDPIRNIALFDYGIVSSIIHGGIMIPQAFIYPNEHAHLWTDIPAALSVAVICWIWHPNRVTAAKRA